VLRLWRRVVRIVRVVSLFVTRMSQESDPSQQKHSDEAEETVKRIEADVVKSTGRNLRPAHGSLEVRPERYSALA
jgi:hypothetical protein